MHSILPTALHELSVSLRIRGDDHDLCIEPLIDIFEHLDCIRSPTFLLGIEQDIPLLWNLALNHVEEDGTERVPEVGSDPDEVPVVELDARRQDGANSRPSADTDSTAVQMSQVWQTCKFHFTCPKHSWQVLDDRTRPISLCTTNHV